MLGPKVLYLSAIGELMWLVNCTRSDISIPVNLLEGFSSTPRRHWNGIKHILRYLQGIIDLDLYYSYDSRSELLADARYLSDSHKVSSQTSYLFTCGDTTISWQSTKQSVVVTSSNQLK